MFEEVQNSDVHQDSIRDSKKFDWNSVFESNANFTWVILEIEIWIQTLKSQKYTSLVVRL